MFLLFSIASRIFSWCFLICFSKELIAFNILFLELPITIVPVIRLFLAPIWHELLKRTIKVKHVYIRVAAMKKS